MASRTASLLLGAALLAATILAGGVDAAKFGEPHATVMALREKDFDAYVTNDPANGLWLLKFYAPW